MNWQTLDAMGWFLGPHETMQELETRYKRYHQEHVSEAIRYSWHKRIEELFAFSSKEIFVIQNNRGLWPWQGAVLWSYTTQDGYVFPVIQVRKTTSLASLEEIYAHECVHMARFAFQEPWFEEILAYQTSKRAWRRFLGPLFLFPSEALLAILALWGGSIASCFCESFFVWLPGILIWSIAVLRLCCLQGLFACAKRRLKQLCHNPLAFLCRLSDREIFHIAIGSFDKLLVKNR